MFRIRFVIPVLFFFIFISGSFAEEPGGLQPSPAEFNPGEVILRWSAPGNDGYSGQAAGYDLRYQASIMGPIDSEEEWNNATRIIGEPTPSIAGEIDSIIIRELDCGTDYYFCITTYDAAKNYSEMSNSPGVMSGDCADCLYVVGDIDGSGGVNLFDVTYLISYLYKDGDNPEPVEAGDVDGSGETQIFDVSYLIGYLYKAGPEPVCMLWQY